ncbi:MAG: hypothetical protein ACW99G_23625 [Candidatus Thorarchaeota archaeon]|jgi:hypothetical protein
MGEKGKWWPNDIKVERDGEEYWISELWEDKKRLDKFFKHDIKLFAATRDAQGIIELVSPANREAFDERVKALEEEPE